MPYSVAINGTSVTKVEEKVISRQSESDISSIEWSWNEDTKECWVKIPDKREKVNIEIISSQQFREKK
jgi:alpha-glucosidase